MPSEYGIVALVMIFVNLANVIIEGGLNTALIQKKNADTLDFSTIFYTSLALSVLLYLLLFVFSQAIASILRQPVLAPVIRVLGISLLFYAVNAVQRAYVSKNMQFRNMFISSLLAVLCSGGVGIWMARHGYGVWALVYSHLVSIFITTLVMWFIISWRPAIMFSFKRLKGLFDYGWKLFLANFFIALFVNVRSLIIGVKYSTAMLAFFDRGRQFPSLIMDNINVSLQAVLFPSFCEEQDDRARLKLMVRRSIKTSCMFIFPLMVGLAVISKPLILVLLTEKWLPAVPFIQIFALAFLMMPMQIANMEAIKSMGYSDIILKLEILKKVLEVTILLVSMTINAHAIALGVVLYNFICIIVNLSPNRRLLDYGILDQLRDVAPSLLVSLSMGFVVFCIQFLHLPNVLLLVSQISVGVAVYILLCAAFRLESFCYIVNVIKERVL